MTEKKNQEQLTDQDLENLSGGQSGDDEAEDSIVVDYGAVRVEYAKSTQRSDSTSTDDVFVDGKIISAE